MYQISGVIADIQGISAGDAMIAAQDILNSLLKQFQELSNINSKPLHTTTMRSTGRDVFAKDRCQIYSIGNDISRMNLLKIISD
jgi:hypothetical protein